MASRHVLIFLNEVAGGRKLLEAVRARAGEGEVSFSVIAPQNQPKVGQLVASEDDVRAAAQARVDVTVAILREFGLAAEGEVMDPEPWLALNDAVRTYKPDEVLISCRPETRFGLLRRDLVETARQQLDCPVEEVFVRIEADAVAWDVTHTLVVANQTVASGDLMAHLKKKASESRHRFTIVCPRSGTPAAGDGGTGIVERLARTLASLYRDGIDATGQPMSPDPFAAIEDALEHYHVDEILISTLPGETSRWLEEDLVGRVRELTSKPVEHVIAGEDAPTPVSVGEDV